MGYSKSEQTLINRLHLLQDLKEHRTCHWRLNADEDPVYFATKIREALYVARLYKQRYPELAAAADMFTIEVVDETTVQARRKRGTTSATVLAGAAKVVNTGLEMVAKTEAPDMATAAHIIEHMLRQQPTNDKFYFPYAHLTDSELLKLWKWGQAQRPRWLMFVTDEGAVNMARYERGLADLAWTPRDIGIEPEPEPKEEEREAEIGDRVLSQATQLGIRGKQKPPHEDIDVED